VDVVSNDTQIVNVEPSKRLKMDELHQQLLLIRKIPTA
jgi:hypothetical protein